MLFEINYFRLDHDADGDGCVRNLRLFSSGLDQNA